MTISVYMLYNQPMVLEEENLSTNQPVELVNNQTAPFSLKALLKKSLTRKQSVFILGGTFLAAISLLSFSYWQIIKLTPSNGSPPLITGSVVKPVLGLSLESPASGDIILDGVVTVKGKAQPKSTIVFFTETDENSVETDTQGNFQGTLALETGINTLTILAIAQNGKEETLTLDLVYDEDQVKGKKTSETPPGQVKKEEAKPAKALIGEVEEITDDSITVINKGKSKVKTKVDKATKIIGSDKKALKLSSLQAEDVAAVITTDDAEATDSGKPKRATKIYVKRAKNMKQSKRRAVHGIITSIDGNTITLAHQIQRDRTYTIVATEETIVKIKGVTDASLDVLEIGQRIAAVGELSEEGGLVVKRIHLIAGGAGGIFKRLPVETSEEATGSPTISLQPTATSSATITPSPTVAIEEPTPTLAI